MNHELTKKEKEIYALIGKGLSNKAIARELGGNYTTIKNQVATIFKKLGVANRVEAALTFHGIKFKIKPNSIEPKICSKCEAVLPPTWGMCHHCGHEF